MYNSIMITHNEHTQTLVLELDRRKRGGPIATYLMRLHCNSHDTTLTRLSLMLRTVEPAFAESAMKWLVENGRPKDDFIYMYDWHRLDRARVLQMREKLLQHFRTKYTNQIMSNVAQIVLECFRLKLMDCEQYKRAVDFSFLPVESRLVGRAVAEDEMERLITHCLQGNKADVRDGAIIAVFSAGLRANEVCLLNLKSYSSETGRLKVMGKGRRERMVYLSPFAQEVLKKWLDIRGTRGEALFCYVRTPHFIYPEKRLGLSGIRCVISRRIRETHTDPFSPHDLRRGVLTTLLDKGVDAQVVARIAGHASVDTLHTYYDRRSIQHVNERLLTFELPHLTYSASVEEKTA